jgi:hypothetical protein
MKKKTEDRRPKTEDRHPVGTTRRVVRPRPPQKKYRTPPNILSLAFANPPFSVSPGPQTRGQHLGALSAKICATRKALHEVATGIVNLKRKLRRQEELYRTLAHNYGSRTAEHTRQLAELSNEGGKR